MLHFAFKRSYSLLRFPQKVVSLFVYATQGILINAHSGGLHFRSSFIPVAQNADEVIQEIYFGVVLLPFQPKIRMRAWTNSQIRQFGFSVVTIPSRLLAKYWTSQYEL